MKKRFKNPILFLLFFSITILYAQDIPEDKMFRDLSSPEISEISQDIWHWYGLNPISLRLLYMGLTKDPQNVELMRSMADVWVEDYGLTALITYAYLLSDEIVIGEDEKESFDLYFSSFMHLWGMSSRKDGSELVQMKDFWEGEKLFDYDMEKFYSMVDEDIEISGSIQASYLTCLRYSGFYAGCLEHKEKGRDIEGNDIYNSDEFVETEEYKDWLNHSVKEIEPMLSGYHE